MQNYMIIYKICIWYTLKNVKNHFCNKNNSNFDL